MSRRSSPAPSVCSLSSDIRHTLSPQEEALQSLCKQLLKARIFRGHYTERRYVESVSEYRDIVALQRGERELEKLLLDVMRKLHLFYQNDPQMWIGVTHGAAIAGLTTVPNMLETFIWTQCDGLAFGEYWFSIKSVRFRGLEILLKLKMLRPYEDESSLFTPRRRRTSSATSLTSSISKAQPVVSLPLVQQTLPEHSLSTTALLDTTSNTESSATSLSRLEDEEPQVALKDFIDILCQWGQSIKQTVYEFMANDISKQNIKGLLQFAALLVISILAGLIAAVRYLGDFTLRLIFEFSRLTHVLTPIVLKVIDVLSKIIGGFYILLTMIWRDTVVNRGAPKIPADIDALTYNRPMYKSIQYNVRESRSRRQNMAQ